MISHLSLIWVVLSCRPHTSTLIWALSCVKHQWGTKARFQKKKTSVQTSSLIWVNRFLFILFENNSAHVVGSLMPYISYFLKYNILFRDELIQVYGDIATHHPLGGPFYFFKVAVAGHNPFWKHNPRSSRSCPPMVHTHSGDLTGTWLAGSSYGGIVVGRTSLHPSGILSFVDPLAYRITSLKSASSSHFSDSWHHSISLKSSMREGRKDTCTQRS